MTSSEDMGTGRTSLGPTVISIADFKTKAANLSRVDRRRRKRMTEATVLTDATRLSDEEWAAPFLMGELYNNAAALGRGVRKTLMTSAAWKKANCRSYGTFKNRGRVVFRFPNKTWHRDLFYDHYEAVMVLKADAAALAVLDKARQNGWSAGQTEVEARKILHGFYEPRGTDVVASLAEVKSRSERYRVILADCPWQYRSSPSVRGSHSAYYSALPLSELEALPVPEVADGDATLFMWHPQCMEDEAKHLMRIWGFKDTQSVIIWRKEGHFGMGARPRLVHEVLRIGIRGKAPLTWFDDVPSVIDAPREPHSRKPAIFHEIIERVLAGPYLEIFGRRRRTGWTVIGDQVSDDLPVEPSQPPRYWRVPPDLLERLKREYDIDDFDPFPYPCAEGHDAFAMERWPCEPGKWI